MKTKHIHVALFFEKSSSRKKIFFSFSLGFNFKWFANRTKLQQKANQIRSNISPLYINWSSEMKQQQKMKNKCQRLFKTGRDRQKLSVLCINNGVFSRGCFRDRRECCCFHRRRDKQIPELCGNGLLMQRRRRRRRWIVVVSENSHRVIKFTAWTKLADPILRIEHTQWFSLFEKNNNNLPNQIWNWNS